MRLLLLLLLLLLLQWLIRASYLGYGTSMLCSSPAVSLDELAQARPLSAAAQPERCLGVSIGRGLVLHDAQQELCLGDTPQVGLTKHSCF